MFDSHLVLVSIGKYFEVVSIREKRRWFCDILKRLYKAGVRHRPYPLGIMVSVEDGCCGIWFLRITVPGDYSLLRIVRRFI